MKMKITAVLLLLGFTAQSFAFDKNALAIHLRKALNLDTRTTIQVGDATPAGFGGLNLVNVTIEGSKYPVYMTKDETKYLWGQAIDFKADPDLERVKAIGLQGVHSQGSPTAPITLVEYSDLQCPHCRDGHKIVRENLYKNYTKDQVRFVSKMFPLSMHEWAEPAAVAVECAGNQREDAYWSMVDSFFDDAPQISSATVGIKAVQYATNLKLDGQKFNACLSDPKVLEKVKAIKAEGIAAGVSSTPTIFVNGRMRRGLRSFDDLKVVIDEKLAEKKK